MFFTYSFHFDVDFFSSFCYIMFRWWEVMKNINEVLKIDLDLLSHSFYDACSNPDFKEYISTLDISEEILMKYTSSLEDAFLECKNCKNCKGLDTCPNIVRGYALTPIKYKDLIDFSYVVCEK